MATTNRAQLETVLRAAFATGAPDRDDLAVYADQLQAEGDVRGELIALDLAAPRDRFAASADGWRDRRHALVVAWVGRNLADRVEELLWLGFIAKLDAGGDAILASPVGDYVRAMDATSTTIVDELVRRPRPWLVDLSIEALGPRDTACLADAVVTQLIAATPALAHLRLVGQRVVDRFDHPSVRHLSLVPHDALGALAADVDDADVAVFAAVERLDLESAPTVDDAGALPALDRAQFPAVTHLDLSRSRREQTKLFTWLRAQPLSAGLARLDVPSLASPKTVTALSKLLDHLPGLADVRVARIYGREALGAELAERVPPVIVPLAVPWPPPHKLTVNSTLVVRIPEETYDDIIALPSLIAFLEHGFEQFPKPLRDAWSALWRSVPQTVVANEDAEVEDVDDEGEGDGAYRYEYMGEPTPLPITTLLRAVEACDELRSTSWERFRAHVRHAAAGLPSDAHVVVFVYY